MGGIVDLAHITAFRRIVEAGSLSAAARSLRVSLATVSRALSSLEAELDTTLVRRTTRRSIVTDAGQRLYQHCVRIESELEEMRALSGNAKDVYGRVVVSAPVSFGTECLVPLLPSFLASYPRLVIDLRLEHRVVDLISEVVHVAVRVTSTPPDSPELIARHLVDVRQLLVASPQYLRARGVPKTPSELRHHDALVFVMDEAAEESWVFRRRGTEHAVKVRGRFRASNGFALRKGAILGLGLALLPEYVVASALSAGELRLVLRDYEADDLSIFAIHTVDHRRSPRVAAVVDHFRTELTRAKRIRGESAP